MKHIILFLTISFFQSSFAQDIKLFDNIWYLHNLSIGGNNYIPPSNDEVNFVSLNFFEPDQMETMVCDVLSADVNFTGLDQFNLFNAGSTFDDCQIQANTDFEILYLDNFFEAHLNDDFNYFIEIDGNDEKILTITNSSNDQAIYGDHILSSQDFYSSQFAILPNPAKNELFLTSKYTSGTLTLKIFNIEGKLLSNQTLEVANQTSIDVSSLTSGIYFLNIEDENGNTTTKKFIKQ
ncbi:MAG: hypothetical protein CL528_03520 [Aequorivita sp.]|nr:hypothetical protein [Aequorivita sp.]MBP40822.1 hypothetical protein [Aequorivita sp.]HBC03819.1 T9SS C-terminal target domain-containing protein [Aequorivita sp.]|tara:strand:+ start:207 stop:914 length:708 start_codon:yes stop_codon:yes gene_type:complete